VSLGIVISLCDETGNMVRPWAEAGYECFCYDIAHSIRVPRRDGNINFLWGDARTVKRPEGNIVAAFAFPPCTHLAVSGARDFVLKGGQMLRDALEIFEACRQVCEWSGAPYCIENPVGVLSSIPHIGKPDHFFDPWHYTAFEPRDHYTKKTGLWIGNGFVMPPQAVAPELAGQKPDNRIHFASPGEDRAAFRSATPMGFARAVFAANAPHLKIQRLEAAE
jgi:hypothetical protein